MDHSRRQFLISMARVAAYAAPVVVTLSAPQGLAAGQSASQKTGGGGKTKALTTDFSTNLSGASQPAPWAVAPPGSSGFPGGR